MLLATLPGDGGSVKVRSWACVSGLVLGSWAGEGGRAPPGQVKGEILPILPSWVILGCVTRVKDVY